MTAKKKRRVSDSAVAVRGFSRQPLVKQEGGLYRLEAELQEVNEVLTSQQRSLVDLEDLVVW